MIALRQVFCLLTLLALVNAHAQTQCYPGLDCPSEVSQASASTPSLGAPIAGLSYTQAFVLDSAQNLAWSRDLYAIGDTTKLFKDAYARNESMADAYAKAERRAGATQIGGFTGWRLATRKEVESLLARMPPTTVYAYFRARSVQLPIRHVLATFEAGQTAEQVIVDGMLYDNTSGGRVWGNIGTPELNPYGVWLVRSFSGEIEKSTAAVAQPLRQYLEPIEELRVRPANAYQVVRRDEVFEVLSSDPKVAKVTTTSALNTRFYARYNLKALPRGALVTAEVQLRGRSAYGAPLPIVKVEVGPGASQAPGPKELWAFANSAPVGIWQMPEAARLELPGHIARNAYNTEADLYLSFAASYNSCEFEIPEMIVRYVRAQNVLATRQLP